jgi:hypothetical protein
VYEKMIGEGMIEEEPAAFDWIIAGLDKLEGK